MSHTDVNQHGRFFSQSMASPKLSHQEIDPMPFGLEYIQKMFDGVPNSEGMTFTQGQTPTQTPQGRGDACIDVHTD